MSCAMHIWLNVTGSAGKDPFFTVKWKLPRAIERISCTRTAMDGGVPWKSIPASVALPPAGQLRSTVFVWPGFNASI